MDVIRAALNELGCEELPLGYDLSMESSFADSPSISKVIRIVPKLLNISISIMGIIFKKVIYHYSVSDFFDIKLSIIED